MPAGAARVVIACVRDHVYATSTFDTERAALDVYAVDGIGPTYRGKARTLTLKRRVRVC